MARTIAFRALLLSALLSVMPAGQAVADVAPERHVVVFLPGFMGWTSQFDEMAERVAQQGHPVRLIPLKGRGMWSSIEDLTADFMARLNRIRGFQRMSFVTHSLGGLVIREYLEARTPVVAARPHTLIMLGTPNHGTEWSPDVANDFPIAASQINPRSQYMSALLARRLNRSVRYVSIWHPGDRVIRPPWSSVLDGALNLELTTDPTFPHATLPQDAQAIEHVVAVLRGTPPPAEGPQSWNESLATHGPIAVP